MSSTSGKPQHRKKPTPRRQQKPAEQGARSRAAATLAASLALLAGLLVDGLGRRRPGTGLAGVLPSSTLAAGPGEQGRQLSPPRPGWCCVRPFHDRRGGCDNGSVRLAGARGVVFATAALRAPKSKRFSPGSQIKRLVSVTALAQFGQVARALFP